MKVKCEYGHEFDIKQVLLPDYVIAQIVPCPGVSMDWEGSPCKGRIVWRRSQQPVDVSDDDD